MKIGKKRQLGLFWDEDDLYFVEHLATKPHQIFHISLEEGKQPYFQEKNSIPSGLSLVSRIEETLRQKEIVPSTLHLSLPSKDIIFRSFITPWLQPNEIKGVVEFEIGKYIPFALDELSYRYHTISITEERTKRLRIIFVAVKKTTLDHYVNILEQAAFNISVVEPAPLSLVRLLIFKNLATSDQNLVIIAKDKKTGKIIIANQGIPQFVREFPLKPLTYESREDIDEKALMIRFINEIRISLDYFKRQDNQLPLNEALFISITPEDKVHQAMQENLNIQVKAITSESLLGKSHPISDLGVLPAFGISLVDSTSTPATFDLSIKRLRHSRQVTKTSSTTTSFKSPIVTAIICLLIIAAAFFLQNQFLLKPKQKLASFNQSLGPYQDSSIKSLEDKKTEISKKLENTKKIRTKSQLTAMLAVIPTLLPEGIWIEKLEITYPDSASYKQIKNKKGTAVDILIPTIELSGYAYNVKKMDQFQLVNSLFSKIKEHPVFKDSFDYIDLDTVETRRIDEYTATYFKIVCQ